MIVPLVEGHSEVEAVPVLMRRLCVEWGENNIAVSKPLRVKRNQVVKMGELERQIDGVRVLYPDVKAVLVILDADDDCPKDIGVALHARAQNRAANLFSCFVVLPNRELEAWFIAGVKGLRGRRGIRQDIEPPNNPEDIRDAKGWLTKAMAHRSYVEVDDQPAFAQLFDIDDALERCRSFRKFSKDFRQAVSLVQS